MVMPDGSTMTAPATGSAGSAGSAASAASTVGAEPSRTSTMVCDGDVKASVQELAAMATPPTTTTSWSDGLFTCTYALPQGALVLKVKESGSPAAAKAYFDGLQAGATDPVALEASESLELPAFRSPVGIVSFVRDDKTLVVDARGLPASVGPQKTERDELLAYSVATNVLSCWKSTAAADPSRGRSTRSHHRWSRSGGWPTVTT